jgi:hypothetical protein
LVTLFRVLVRAAQQNCPEVRTMKVMVPGMIEMGPQCVLGKRYFAAARHQAETPRLEPQLSTLNLPHCPFLTVCGPPKGAI